MGSHLIIAGAPYLKVALPDRIRLKTFLDPGGYSFYASTGSRFAPLVGTNEFGERQEVVSVRSVPGSGLRPSLGGQGWGSAGADAVTGLRTAVHSVVLHHDGCFSPDACYRTLVSRCLSTHVMIGRDGQVYQCADLADRTYHAGSMNNVAVGIDLNNRAHNLLSEPHAELDGGVPSPIRTINGGSFRSWNYTDAQYDSLVEVLRVVIDALGIEPVFPLDEQGSILYSVVDSPPADQFKGFLCHWHITPQKWDPGPGLDWEAILAGLRRNAATVPVVPAGLASELRPEDLPGVRVTPEELADPARAPARVDELLSREATAVPFLDAVCRTVERRQMGGFYPVGVNQTWHGGIHLEAEAGTPVRPLLKGELVAAHLVPDGELPESGSNNFVLLRHRIPLPPRSAPGAGAPCRFLEDRDDAGDDEAVRQEDEVLTVFSLYMHLQGVDFDRPGDNALVNRFVRRPGDDVSVPPAKGPRLETFPGADPGAALRAGYVALFSPLDDPAAAIEVGPSEVIGHVGGLRNADGDLRPLVHVEVFADDRYLEAMEMALYGRFLQVGPQDPDSRDLVVRSVPLLTRMLPSRRGRRVREERRDFGDKVLTADRIRDWYLGDADPEDLETLRSLVVGHVSEWSDQVQWVQTLLANQRWWQDQGTRLINPDRVGWVFAQELADALKFVWLTDEVADWIGLKRGGMVHTFHPLRFLAWWMFLRSAVRAKSLDEILRCLKGRPVSLLEGVPDVLGDKLDMPGPGQWES